MPFNTEGVEMKNIIAVFSLILLCFNLFSQQFRTYKQAYQYGTYKLQQKLYQEARKDLLEALNMAETDEDKSLTTLNIGHAYFGEADYENAREMYAKVLEIEKGASRDKMEAQIKTAESYLMGKNYPEALTSFEKILAKKNITPLTEADILARISQIYLAEKNYSKQRETLERIIGMDEPLPVNKLRAMLQTGDSFTAEKKYDEAIAAFNRILETEYVSTHARVDALIKMGQIYNTGKNYPEAVNLYKQVIAMGKDAPEWLVMRALLGLAGIYRIQEQFSQARDLYYRLIEIIDTTEYVYYSHTKLTAMCGIADSYREEGNDMQAHEEYEKVLETGGMYQLSESQIKEAESRIGKNEPAETVRTAENYYYKRKFSAAREEYNKVLDMEQANIRQKTYAQLRIADICSVGGKYPDARTGYEKVLNAKTASSAAINSYKLEAQKKIANIYRAEGNFETAKTEYAKILKMESVTPSMAEEIEQRIDSIYW